MKRDDEELNQLESQRRFVEDLLAEEPVAGDVLDLGTGTARIPVLLCQQVAACRIMAADRSVEMLDQARYTIEVHGVIERVQLDHCDARKMLYKDGMFDLVLSHRVLHEVTEPLEVLREAVRVTRATGRLFFRDFLRPADDASLERMVRHHADGLPAARQEWFRQSLRAAWRLDEIQAVVEQVGFEAATVRADPADGCWTWSARRPENER
jgi:ubiquinone/menaquinone biosynthesis C-methylase UbiE